MSQINNRSLFEKRYKILCPIEENTATGHFKYEAFDIQKAKSKLIAKCRARINSNENVEKILKFMMTDNWNIKKLIDVFLLDDCSFFVYDHETGVISLFELLMNLKNKRTDLTYDKAGNYLCQIVIGTNYLHQNNILHSYLNSKDIYYYPNEFVKIGGFYYMEQLNSSEKASTMNRKLPYKCSNHEQANITLKYDHWCIAWILYEICTFEHQPNVLDRCNDDLSDFQSPKLPEKYKKLNKFFECQTNVNPNERRPLNEELEDRKSLQVQRIERTLELQKLDYRGKRIKDYDIQKFIGMGAYGTVFEVTDSNNKKMILKHLRDPIASFRNNRNEGAHHEKLIHPNIARLIEHFEINAEFYIVTEFCNGPNLDDYLKLKIATRQKLANKNILLWSMQIFDALDYAHSLSIMHRDIKPSNIMLHKNNENARDDDDAFEIKLIDFGESKNFKSIVAASSVCGTPCYMAPEVFAGNYNLEADVWSVGCVLYEMVEQKSAYSSTPNEIIEERIKGELPAISQGIFMEHILVNIFKHQPEERYSAKEALEALRSIDITRFAK